MSKKEIILIVPKDHAALEPMRYPNLGLLYIASVLEQDGWDVSIYDMREEENTIDKIPLCDMYGFTSSTPQIVEVKKNSKILREKGAYTIIGGHFASYSSESIKNDFDAIVIGEGESIILDILNNRKKGIFNGFETSKKQDINSIPYPARHLLSKEKIVNNVLMSGQGFEDNNSLSTTMICSRGCPNRCNFCANIPQKVRFRSIENISGEIELLKRDYNCHSYKLLDDNILVNKKFFKELCEYFRAAQIEYRCSGRSDMIDDKTCELLRWSGCREMAIGIETIDDNILAQMNKRETIEDHKKAIKSLKKYGVDVRAYFMVGFPGETWETIENIKKFVMETRPEKWMISMFIPYPGSPIYNNPEQYGYEILEKNWEEFYQLYPTRSPYKTSTSSQEEINMYHKDLVKFFKEYSRERK